MAYWYSERTGVQSYMQGVNYGALMQDALNPNNRTAENERLSTSSTQDDYFKKRRLIKEAIQQLQNNGYVEPKIAKEVDVNALKESLQKSTEGEASALSMLGQGTESSEARKQSQMIAQEEMLASSVNISDKEQTPIRNPLEERKKKEIEDKKKAKESISQSVENDTLIKRESKKGGILDKAIVQTSSKAPNGIAKEVKDAHNPLEVTEDTKNDKTIKQAVEFIDEVSGKKVSVPLNDANAQKLIEQFGSLEEASDYVKGFYYDAAYKMGYLSGDSDGNGQISLEEGVHLKSLVSLLDGSYYSIADRIGGDLESQKKFLEQVGFIDNIGDFINHSIAQDSNFDGAISLNEMMGDDGKAVLFKVGAEASGNVEMFVIWKFNFDLTQDSLGDTLLNLGAKDENKVEVADKKDVKSYVDTNYLESLEKSLRENVLKSDILLKNMIEQNMVESV
ncbi:hypothetical protein LS70_004400 [Helicobacter sp. MIT 11-5569]|uniref:hypothetical protein n=1 Tax=Helicobacter sp. MIT 11-5569 TaxID=1548151 RepID=UPI00068C752E|nr:hypothetical protein [Helicobacter sp. MIT 11-5569]TLD84051.1 hypothetical protein LS70_004400 [Helicobacter sp. MIT 11-5569]